MSRDVLSPERVSLLLALVPYLRANGPTSIRELADVFRVDARVLRQLIVFLGTAGIPGETAKYQHDDLFDIDWDALERDDVASLTNTVAIDAAPRFSGRETAALLAGLSRLTELLGKEQAARANTLAKRLQQAFPEETDHSGFSIGGAPEGAAGDSRIAMITDAIAERASLRFRYTDRHDRVSNRVVVPSEVFEQDHQWYLRAWCRDREAERTFRLDQIDGMSADSAMDHASANVSERSQTQAITGGAGGASGGGASEGGASEGAVADAAQTSELQVLTTKRGLAKIRRFAPQVLEARDDDRLLVRVEAWYPSTAIRLVALSGGELEVVAPASARAAVASWARRALEASARE